MNIKSSKRDKALAKELGALHKQEQTLERTALNAKPLGWKRELEQKIPEKVRKGLESAFCKGFSLVFNQGRGLIEKSYSKEDILTDYSIRDYAIHLKGGRKELKQMRKSAQQSDLRNLAVTTVEGIGLGALGIGMPDVVLFLSALLKGIYETALNFGFDYESRWEQLLILKMMAVPLQTGERWHQGNAEVNALLTQPPAAVSKEEFQAQLRETAAVFAMDMLLLKFIQGLPIVGILGGAANPVYYTKVLKYVQLKYRRRYLHKLEINTLI